MMRKRHIIYALVVLLAGVVVAMAVLSLSQHTNRKKLFAALDSEDNDTTIALLDKSPRLVNEHRYGPAMLPSFGGRNDTPLTIACLRGDKPLIDALLTRGADVNTCESFLGESPLLCILESHSSERYAIALELIDCGADPFGQTDMENVFSVAVRVYVEDSPETQEVCVWFLETLVGRGVEFECPEWYQQHYGTLLGIAAGSDNAAVVRYLLERGVCEVNAQSRDGATALMIASETNATEAARILLQYGADPALEDEAGLTAFDRAAAQGNAEILALLDNFQ